ncbi:uncharacterized [Tachysurus ichikawai]
MLFQSLADMFVPRLCHVLLAPLCPNLLINRTNPKRKDKPIIKPFLMHLKFCKYEQDPEGYAIPAHVLEEHFRSIVRFSVVLTRW